MSHTRFLVIMILLVAILLAASAAFGLLTYWLEANVLLHQPLPF
ncbi:MAG: hypothetical protein PVH11_03325 [Anaerolineae bacterium]|jgi:hypothetical protein